VVKCNVPKRGWINGVGGCPNVGGICIGCTMPSFPDKFMPFMEQLPITWRSVPTPYPGSPASAAESASYGAVIRQLREFALKKFDTEPEWRGKRTPELSPDRPRSAREAVTDWWHHRGRASTRDGRAL
jgi:hydrogenase small subunit